MGHTSADKRTDTTFFGSSPRAWGILHQSLLKSFYIPVHPHVRGAYDRIVINAITNFNGSSPRAWGIQSMQLFFFLRFRFIPTCVGHTQWISACGSQYCRFIPTCVGHTASCISTRICYCGSSPRAWGIRPVA